MPEEIDKVDFRNLESVLSYISYGSQFKLEYDGSSWNDRGEYGTWHAQFYDGFRASGATYFEALDKAWEMLPQKPNPYCDIAGFNPNA